MDPFAPAATVLGSLAMNRARIAPVPDLKLPFKEKLMTQKLNVGDAFRSGEVWRTSRGGLYRVMGFETKPGKRRQAVLRVGSDGAGRKVLRDWDGVVGWTLFKAAPMLSIAELEKYGFKPVSYRQQEGTFYAKTLAASDMPQFLKHVVDNEIVFDTDKIVVEVCPDNTVQLVDQDNDYVQEPVLVGSAEGRALLRDAGFIFADEGETKRLAKNQLIE